MNLKLQNRKSAINIGDGIKYTYKAFKENKYAKISNKISIIINISRIR
jgi:hypothetical protein